MIDDVSTAVARAIKEGSSKLDPAASTCVVVPDATRPLPFEATLRPVLEYLDVGDQPTIVLVALGLHRPMTTDELAPIERACRNLDIHVVQHDPHGDLVDFGTTGDIPIQLNRRIVEADQVICIGTVEPHQYAGYSGGIKAASIGCASAPTISAMHGLTFLRDEQTALGRVADNPFQQALWRIGAPLGNILGLQLVPAIGGGIESLFFGDIDEAFTQAQKVAEASFFESFDTAFDWLHLSVPAVKASNFYQASRAATYVALIDRPAIRRGGTIVVDAACPEGMGDGEGERACASAIARGKDALLRELHTPSNKQIRGGQQRAYVLARACDRNRIALVGAPKIDVLDALGIDQFDTVDEAIDALDLHEKRGCRIDDVFHRIPRLASEG